MSVTTGTPVANTMTTSWDGSAFRTSMNVTTPSGTTDLFVAVFRPANTSISFTFNGDAVGSAVIAVDDTDSRRVDLFVLHAPDIGSNLALTLTASVESNYLVVAVPVLGSNGYRTPDSANSATNYNTTATASPTTVAGDLVLDAVYAGAALTVGAGQTSLATLGAGPYAAVSSETASGTSTTMSWSLSSERWVTAALAFIPAAGGGSAVRSLVNNAPGLTGFTRNRLIGL